MVSQTTSGAFAEASPGGFAGLDTSGDPVTSDSQHSSNLGVGSIPVQPGELLFSNGADMDRPLSAPPMHQGSDILHGAGGIGDPSAEDAIYSFAPHQGYQAAEAGAFGNLAAVLGSGLAASMEDDGSHERKQINALFGAAIKDDMSYQRQARHSRMNGIASSTDASAAFAAFSGKGGPNQSLFGSSLYNSLQGNTDVSSGLEDHSGFPSLLSTPQRKAADREREDAVRRSTTPVQMFPGQPRAGDSFPTSRDIGTLVDEPEEEKGERSSPNKSSFELQGGSLFSTDAKEFKPSAAYDAQSTGGNSSLSDTYATELSSRQVEAELRLYIWDINRNQPSRTLAILHASYLRVPDVRSACESFGVIDNFRAEFATRGIFFVSYFDIRSAQYAALELQGILQRAAIMQGSNEDVLVRYCLPLDSSKQFDESRILVTDLPSEIGEAALEAMMSSFGAVRSIVPQGPGSFSVEFQNLQDARQARLEVESIQPWGPGVNVENGTRDTSERMQGREMLSMIAKWRQSFGKSSTMNGRPNPAVNTNDPWRGQGNFGQESSAQFRAVPSMASHGRGGMYGNFPGGIAMERQYVPPHTDMTYQHYGVNKNPMYHQQASQQLVQGPDGQFYIASAVIPQTNQGYHSQFMRPVDSHGHFSDSRSVHSAHSAHSSAQHPYMVSDNLSAYSGRSHRSVNSMNEEKDNRHLQLDLEAVEMGRDNRTSLMVRNIPNKYTQQMLLSEFSENGHGPGTIDFFYLPIDFKNRCNRGYAFINFVDHKDILAFHRRYFGKHWRTFNSDKICDITYARIQGKAAMLKRFENSALMEKDDEYKPLVFVSDGPEKGRRLPFPDPANRGH